MRWSVISRPSRNATALGRPRWPWSQNDGLSLIELLIALSLLAIIAVVLSVLLISTLQSQEFGSRQDEMVQTARLAMQRMVAHARQANRVLLPLGSHPVGSVLALGGFIDNDGDGRYDEDPHNDLTDDGAAGIVGIDDDGDGSVDEGSADDDDEDGLVNEDPVNGLDDDGDGAIDEDASDDLDNNGVAGILKVDDDGDGTVDESSSDDDDEDTGRNEDPVEALVYYLDPTTKTLWERYPTDAGTTMTTALAEQVETFQVQRLIGANSVVLIDILLRVRNDQGNVVELQTQVYPRNQ